VFEVYKKELVISFVCIEFLVHRDLQQKTKSYDEDGKDGEVIPGKVSSSGCRR
jgi:hypothetical protein